MGLTRRAAPPHRCVVLAALVFSQAPLSRFELVSCYLAFLRRPRSTFMSFVQAPPTSSLVSAVRLEGTVHAVQRFSDGDSSNTTASDDDNESHSPKTVLTNSTPYEEPVCPNAKEVQVPQVINFVKCVWLFAAYMGFIQASLCTLQVML